MKNGQKALLWITQKAVELRENEPHISYRTAVSYASELFKAEKERLGSIDEITLDEQVDDDEDLYDEIEEDDDLYDDDDDLDFDDDEEVEPEPVKEKGSIFDGAKKSAKHNTEKDKPSSTQSQAKPKTKSKK